jgi:integrase
VKSEVNAVVPPLLNGVQDILTLVGSPLREYERAKKIANEMGPELDEAMQSLRDAKAAALAKFCSVNEALDYWAKHHDQSKFDTSVPKVAEAFLLDRHQMGNSDEDIASMRSRLRRFAASFECPLRDITKAQYLEYFASLSTGLRDRKNHWDTVRRLVNWARNSDYLPCDHPGLPKRASRVKIPPKRVQVFDAEQRERLLRQARPIEMPITLIEAYTPVRLKEAALVSWEDINWEAGIMMVYADGAKKRESRTVYLVPELVERLRPYARPAGRIYPFRNYYKLGLRLARKAKIRWTRNGWRCTIISHLQAFIRDLGRVAGEAGNSITEIKRSYLKILLPSVGRKYFGLVTGELHPLEPAHQMIEQSSHTDSRSVATAPQPKNLIEISFGAGTG